MPVDWNHASDDDDPYFDDLGDDVDFDDGLDEVTGDEETGTIPCHHCGTEVYEEAPACPICGELIVRSTHPFAEKPAWYIALGVVGIIAVIWTLLI